MINPGWGKMGPKLRQRLNDTSDVRNRLADCKTPEDAARAAVELVRERLVPQVASIFLFDKAGWLKRVAIAGTDANGAEITDSWFPEERYRSGESFTGRAVVPTPGSRYGLPQSSNRVGGDVLEPESRKLYLRKLGDLSCVIAVPLNGRHRSFGVIQVINKLDGRERPSEDQFSPDDVFWLALIANIVAATISHLRRQSELSILNQLSKLLVEPYEEDGPTPEIIYQQIADILVGRNTCYTACVIRIEIPSNSISIIVKSSDVGVSWKGWINTPIGEAGTINGEVFRTGVPLFVPDVSEPGRRFRNSAWIQANRLRAYGCLPLRVKRGTLGTLSVFAGFTHRFDGAAQSFLDNVTNLIASLIEGYRTIGQIGVLRDELTKESDRFMSIARAASSDTAVKELVHQYKNELLDVQRALKDARDAGSARSSHILARQISWIESRLGVLTNELTGQHSPVEINYLIRDVVKYFKNNQQGPRISFSLDLNDDIPAISVSERDITDSLTNLLSNAVKAIRLKNSRGGCVEVVSEVVVEKGIRYIQVSVEDNGIGIRNEYLDRIADQGFTTYEGGTGMGLFLVRSTMENYGGRLLVLSTAVGKGTIIAVRIPLRRHQVAGEIENRRQR
jgi:signal transduction histidine kinase